jgi:hypothetical protein
MAKALSVIRGNNLFVASGHLLDKVQSDKWSSRLSGCMHVYDGRRMHYFLFSSPHRSVFSGRVHRRWTGKDTASTGAVDWQISFYSPFDACKLITIDGEVAVGAIARH